VLTWLGFGMVVTFMTLIMTRRLSPLVALIAVPILFALLAGFAGTQLGEMMLAGLRTLAPTGVMLMFAILYFGLMIDAGLFDPLIRAILRAVHGDPTRIVVGTALLAAIAPILATRRTDLTDLLKAGARGISGGHQRLRGVLVVSQLAVCVTIVVCAALFARSAANASRIDPGFRTDHIMIATSQLGTQGYDSVRGAQFEREIERHVAGLPGVRSVALARYTPFGYNNDIEYLRPEAPTAQVPDNGIGAFNNIVTPSYFETMRIPIVEGRGFEERDNASAPNVALITRAMAKRIWPGQSALGKRFRVAKDGPVIEVVGVTGDIQYFSLGETPKPFLFRPYAQWYRSSFTLVVHTTVDPTSLAGAVRGAVTSLDPTLPVFDVRSFDEHIRSGRALLGTRLGAAFSEVFGGLALLLAAVGLYGLLSYAVAQRTREIGIRLSLGASQREVVRLVLQQGMRLVALGSGIGLVLGLGAGALLSKRQFGIAPFDLPVLVGAAVLFAAATVVIALLPARATDVDVEPVEAGALEALAAVTYAEAEAALELAGEPS